MLVAIDFDGVLHLDQGAWQGAEHIPGPMVPGAAEFLRALWRAGHTPVVHTCRAREAAGAQAVAAWLERELGCEPPEVTAEKPLARIYIDDRGYRFEGAFPSIDEVELFAERTWTRP